MRHVVDELDLAEVLDLGVRRARPSRRPAARAASPRPGDRRGRTGAPLVPGPSLQREREREGIDDVGRRHLRAVVEDRRQDPVDDLRARRRSPAARPAAPPARRRARGRRPGLRRGRARRDGADAVGHPARRCWAPGTAPDRRRPPRPAGRWRRRSRRSGSTRSSAAPRLPDVSQPFQGKSFSLTVAQEDRPSPGRPARPTRCSPRPPSTPRSAPRAAPCSRRRRARTLRRQRCHEPALEVGRAPGPAVLRATGEKVLHRAPGASSVEAGACRR